MIDPVLTALQTALSSATDGTARRSLLLALGERHSALAEHGLALERFAEVLSQEPANVAVLEKAAAAAEASGAEARAAGYRQLVRALSGSVAPSLSVATAPEGGEEAPPERLAVPLSGNGRDADSPEAGGAVPFAGGPSNVLRLVEGGPDAKETSFADVGGLEAVKKRINLAFLAPLRQPELFAAYGKSIKGGLLLYGPPGCGKTHLARATAGEVGARFTSIGLVDVLDMWIGESEKRLHELFETARREAPTVLFLDELDALGQKRSQLRHSAGRNLVNQLLVELDGLDSGDGVYVLAATNHPWDVDSALKRPGRFDRTVFVPPPDAAARTTILDLHLKHRPVQGLDLEILAARTKGMSGADLVHLCDSAVEQALDEALSTGNRRPVGMQDFEHSLTEVKPSIGPWVEVARNYALYANEGGSYDELSAWLKKRR